MQRRLRRTSIAWFTMAAVMSAIAIVLTVMITWVRPVAPPLVADEQFIGVLIPSSAAEDVESTHVIYSEARGRARISLMQPADGSVFLVSGLEHEDACSPMVQGRSPQRLPDMLVSHAGWVGRMHDLYAIAPSSEAIGVVCDVPAKSRRVSFTARELTVEYASDQYVTIPVADATAEQQRLAFLDAAKVVDLVSVPSLLLDLNGISGTDNMRYAGGFERSDETVGGAWRRLAGDEWMTATWSDIHRQQFRDILLIVIGTLIGIAVTVMIEGLRPVIEQLEHDAANPLVAREHRRKKE